MCLIGFPGAALGDGDEWRGRGSISFTGTFQFILHKAADLRGTALEGLDFPMLETADDWVMHGFSYPNYLEQLGDIGFGRNVPWDIVLAEWAGGYRRPFSRYRISRN